MAAVDMSNPYYRDFFPKWLALHEKRLNRIRSLLPHAAAARAAEAGAAEAAGREARLRGPCSTSTRYCSATFILTATRPPRRPGPDLIDFHAADFFVDPATKRSGGATIPQPPAGRRRPSACGGRSGHKNLFHNGPPEHLRKRRCRISSGSGSIPRPSGPGGRRNLTLCPPGKDPALGSRSAPTEGRCKQIEKTHRIVINVGDQVSDLGLHGDNHFLLGHPFYMIA